MRVRATNELARYSLLAEGAISYTAVNRRLVRARRRLRAATGA